MPNKTLPCLPEMGEVLGFVVDCLGVTKETESYTHKEIQRLKKGGLSHEKYWKVAYEVVIAVVASFIGDKSAADAISKAFLQKLCAPLNPRWVQTANGLWVPVPRSEALPDALFWRVNQAGEIENLPERLVLDWLEFLERNEYLKTYTEVQCRTRSLLRAYLSIFVIPFLAYNLIEYLEVHASVERGMPGGQFWYLPDLVHAEGNKSYYVAQWPINKVLGWWEDLLGKELYPNAVLLFPDGYDTDEARRQVHFWRYESRTPDPETILRWCKRNWDGNYKGIFTDDVTTPLHERWNRCRAFLVGKGLDRSTTNWVDKLPEEARVLFKRQGYRGEPLEQQILRFKEASFSEFFDAPDPIAKGLPVEELIQRVAERYASPTTSQLKGRLLLASAFQRAFLALKDRFGIDFAASMLGFYKQIYFYLMELQNYGTTKESRLEFLASTPPSKLLLRSCCEWLFDEQSWYQLPRQLTDADRMVNKPRT